MEKHLHIICFTVPYPVTYGGVFDLFYKLPALQQQGVHIHLHCFTYGQQAEQTILNKYCSSVQYYQRNILPSFNLPYIVSTRKNEVLFERLLQDNYPILMEGVHCSYLLNDPRFANRKKFVRLHNVEHKYYNQLYFDATSFFKKLYYQRERNLLKRYEKNIINKLTACWGVSETDVCFFREAFNCNTIDYLPVYLPDNWQVKCLEGKGSFCLYQGDLSVESNEKIVRWLLQEVFKNLQIPFVIAGKNPSKQLIDFVHQQQHACLVANPDEKEMQDMIQKAHINILPAYATTGVKLKTLNALFNGRHCLVNDESIAGIGLQSLCHIANNATDMKVAIKELFEKSFEKNEIEKRRTMLATMFNNELKAKQQVAWIWGSAE